MIIRTLLAFLLTSVSIQLHGQCNCSGNPLQDNNTTEDITFGIGFTTCNGQSCYEFTEANGDWHDDPVDITFTFNAFPQIGIDFQGGCPPYEISVSHVPAGGPPGDPNILWGGAMQCIEFNVPTPSDMGYYR